MVKIFILIFVIYALTNVPVTASEHLPSIYVMENMYFGTDTNVLSEQRMNYKEIENIVKNSYDVIEIYLDNGILKEIKNGETYTYQNNSSLSTAFINNELFDILSDKKWLETELYKHAGIYDNIHNVMYKQNAHEYMFYGNTEVKDAWLFGNDNVYLADVTIHEQSAEVTDVLTFDEWYDLIEYKPIGKCIFDKRIIAENVYVNNEEAMVPMRAVVEAIGGKVEWDDKNKSATMYYDEENYVLKYIPGQDGNTGGLILKKNGLPQALGRTSGLGNYCIDNGTTYLNFLTAKKLFSNMNVGLYYDFADKTIEIIKV